MATERQIDDLIDQLRDLVPELRSFTRTGTTGIGNDGTNKLINAIGLLAINVNKTSKVYKNEAASLQKFSAKVDRATKEQEDLAKVSAKLKVQTADAVAVQRDLNVGRRQESEALKRGIHDRMRDRSTSADLFREFGQGINATSLLRDKFEQFGEKVTGNIVHAKALTAAFSGITKAAALMATALYKGERGASVAARSFTALSQPMADLGIAVSTLIAVLSFFGPAGMIGRGLKLFGVALGAVAGALTLTNKYNELGAEQADRLFKSFRELSQVGGATAEGMDGVFTTLQTMGMTAAELEQFNQLIRNNAKSLVLMGTSAGDGARQLALVAGGLYKSDLGRQLEMLGVSAEEQRESALVYMSIQARTGQLQVSNTKKLIEESSKFARELDLAAQLTGQTRKEQAEAREAALAEERFRSAVIAARSRGDQAELARLERFGAAAAAVRAFDSRGATGILQAGAGRGALSTPEAVAAEMTYGVNRVLSDPNMPLPDALRAMAQNARMSTESLADVTALTGTIGAIQTDIVGVDNFVQRMEPIIKAAADSGQSITEFMKSEQGRRLTGTENTRLMVEGSRAQQSAAMIMDSVVYQFNGAARINKAASTAFRDAVKVFASTVGASVTGGTPGGTGPGAPAAARRPGFSAGGAATPVTGDYLSRLMQLESGGRNIETQVGGGTSTAFGLYQITKTTFDSLVANAEPGSPLRGKTFEDMKVDTELQRVAAQSLTQGNAALLARRGLSTSDAAKYMSHMLGYPVAARVLEASANLGIEKLVPERSRINNPAIFKDVATAGDLRQRFSDITGGGGYRFGGVASGPKSGYAAVLHGTEAVVPLPDGKTIPVSMPDFSGNMQQQIGMMSQQISRLDEMVTLMRQQNSTSEKILRVTVN